MFFPKRIFDWLSFNFSYFLAATSKTRLYFHSQYSEYEIVFLSTTNSELFESYLFTKTPFKSVQAFCKNLLLCSCIGTVFTVIPVR